MVTKQDPPRRGRRRDASVDERLNKAAVALYGEVGWAGFHFDALARRGGVGKAALYLRWRSEEDVLRHALDATARRLRVSPAGEVRAELLDLSRQVLELYSGPAGQAFRRLAVEREVLPRALRAWYAAFTTAQVRAARALVREAVQRRELPPGTSGTLLLDALLGAIVIHVGATPPRLWARMLRGREAYLEDLVDFVLAGVQAWQGHRPSPRA